MKVAIEPTRRSLSTPSAANPDIPETPEASDSPAGAPSAGGRPRPGRPDWYSFRRPDHARLAAEDRQFYAEAIRAVREAAARAAAASNPSSGTSTVETPASESVVSETATDADPTTRPAAWPLVRNLPVKPQNQFDGNDRNACGTTSLASILAYYDPGSPIARHQVLDRALRNADLFSAPDELLRFARGNGYRAGLRDNASVQDIKALIDQGVPVQVLVDPDGDGGDITLHYVAVTGYKADPDGKITHLTITDPAGGEVYEETADHFLARWSNLRIEGIEVGLNRVMLAYVPDDGRLIQGADGQVRRASEVDLPDGGVLDGPLSDSQRLRTPARGIANVVNGGVHLNPGRVLGGVVQTLGGGIMGVVGTAGHYLDKAGDGAFDWATDRWREGPAAGKVAAVFGFAGGAMAKGAGVPLEVIGNGASWAVGKVGDGIGWLGDMSLSGLKAVGKLFDGW